MDSKNYAEVDTGNAHLDVIAYSPDTLTISIHQGSGAKQITLHENGVHALIRAMRNWVNTQE